MVTTFFLVKAINFMDFINFIKCYQLLILRCCAQYAPLFFFFFFLIIIIIYLFIFIYSF